MNRKLLQKVIDELLKEKPDLSYIRGILETLIESLPEDNKVIYNPEKDTLLVTNRPKEEVKKELTDEASILDAKARMAIEKMKAFSQTNYV